VENYQAGESGRKCSLSARFIYYSKDLQKETCSEQSGTLRLLLNLVKDKEQPEQAAKILRSALAKG
jgi:hypothetical protein